MSTVLAQSDPDQNTQDLRSEVQGLVTFYHSRSTPGFWFNAGELEAMVDQRHYLELPEPKEELEITEEFTLGPEHCPRCGSGGKLFEMKSYLSAEVSMKACHVCHGRWIGHHSLELLMEHMRFQGLLGSIKRLFVRPSGRAAAREA